MTFFFRVLLICFPSVICNLYLLKETTILLHANINNNNLIGSSIELDDATHLLNEGDFSHPPYLPNYWEILGYLIGLYGKMHICICIQCTGQFSLILTIGWVCFRETVVLQNTYNVSRFGVKRWLSCMLMFHCGLLHNYYSAWRNIKFRIFTIISL